MTNHEEDEPTADEKVRAAQAMMDALCEDDLTRSDQPQLRAGEADPRGEQSGDSRPYGFHSCGRIDDLMHEHDLRDMDDLKHALEDYRRWRQEKLTAIPDVAETEPCLSDTARAVLQDQVIARLEHARDEARRVVRDTLWMAGRYADGRRSYAVGLYNDALAIAQKGGYAEGARPARDGMHEMVGSAPPSLSEASASTGRSAAPESGWQSISTAPKDGTSFLAWEAHYSHANVARYHQSEFRWLSEEIQMSYTGMWSGRRPTHWMPLPAPPSEEK